MTSPDPGPDPRLNAFRQDLADAALTGLVDAGRFVSPTHRRIIKSPTLVRRAPDQALSRDTEFLLGEPVKLFAEQDGWAWVQSARDHYVGYIDSAALGPCDPEPTHRVEALHTFCHPEPDLKTLPVGVLGYGDCVHIVAYENSWVQTSDSYWLYGAHLRTPEETGDGPWDPACTALRFLETPYLWGGRSSKGLDCSALVQFALHAHGAACPRDSDQQEERLGTAAPSPPIRNDLVFWPGHVGIMIDEARILHANATDMAVRIWPLDRLEAHIKTAQGDDIRSIKRLSPPSER